MCLDDRIQAVLKDLQSVKWRSYKENPLYEWYYAENENFLIREKLTGALWHKKAKSPKQALQKVPAWEVVPIDEDQTEYADGDAGALCFEIDEHGNVDGIYFGHQGDGWDRHGDPLVPEWCNYCIRLPWESLGEIINFCAKRIRSADDLGEDGRRQSMSEIRAEHIPGTDEMKIYVNGVFVRCCNFWEVGETMEELAQREREKERANESET